MNWLRLYTDVLHKRKIQSLPGELFKAWINLLLIARQNNGVLLPLPEIAFQLHVEPELAAAWVTALIDRRLFDQTAAGVVPHDWFEYQYDSDDAALRKRKYRAAKRVSKSVLGHVPTVSRARAEQNRKEVTPSGVTENPGAVEMPPSQIEEARQLLSAYPEARGLSGAPDSVLAAHCLDLAGGSIEELGRGLRALMLTGKKPSLSWAWFRTVLPTYLDTRRRA